MMKFKIPFILNACATLFLSQSAFAQTHPPDSNADIGHPVQTDKVLLRDGSEKQHITKKTNPTATPEQKANQKENSTGAALPTDVD